MIGLIVGDYIQREAGFSYTIIDDALFDIAFYAFADAGAARTCGEATTNMIAAIPGMYFIISSFMIDLN